jgi:hypothetical protein
MHLARSILPGRFSQREFARNKPSARASASE